MADTLRIVQMTAMAVGIVGWITAFVLSGWQLLLMFTIGLVFLGYAWTHSMTELDK